MYLIQLDGGIRHVGRTSKLHLCPIDSPRAHPINLEELHYATHDMLHGLQDLHKASYVHNNLRWDNCIKVNVKGEWKWVIIDLEYVRKDGEVWEDEALVSWDEEALESHEGRGRQNSSLDQKKRYSKGSDVYQLGELILKRLDAFQIGGGNPMLLQSLQSMGAAMMEKRVVAAKFKCAKNCRRSAMFK
jgi:hypothetical protein